MEKEFLTPQEVAALLGVSRRTVTNWIKAGQLPALKIGRTVRVNRADLEKKTKEKEAA